MTRVEVLEEIVRQDGNCDGIDCRECPLSKAFGDDWCNTRKDNLKTAKAMLAEEKNNMEYKKALTSIIIFFGCQNQIKKSIEELAELQCELAREGTDRFDINKLEEEIADVTIMLEQIKIMYDIKEEKINVIKNKKIFRTLDKIKGLKDERF